MKYLFLLIVNLICILTPNINFAQNDVWTDYLSYTEGIMTENANDRIFCITPNSMFAFDKTDNSIQKYSKINGLSDIGFSTIVYNAQYKMLFIGYSNGNIDLLFDKEEVKNIPDIKRKALVGLKKINHAIFIGKNCYIATSFGIVVLNMETYEIVDYFYLDQYSPIAINELCFGNNFIYAATQNGVFKAHKDSVLNNMLSWKKIKFPDNVSTFNTICWFNNRLVVNYRNAKAYFTDTIYVLNKDTITKKMVYNYNHRLRINNNTLTITNEYFVDLVDTGFNVKKRASKYLNDFPIIRCAVTDADSTFWIADRDRGMVRYQNDTTVKYIYPSGPPTNRVNDVIVLSDQLWIAPGGKWDNTGVYAYLDGVWNIFAPFNVSAMQEMVEIQDICVNPQNNNEMYAASMSYGIAKFTNKKFDTKYDETNSSLQNIDPYGRGYMWIRGMAFDKKGNLWANNSLAKNPVVCKKQTGEWYNFSGNNIGALVTPNYLMLNSLATSYGPKWFTLTNTNDLIFFDENNTFDNTNDDLVRRYTAKDKYSSPLADLVYCMIEDKDSIVWLGTNRGIALFYNPQYCFNTDNKIFYGVRPCLKISEGDSVCRYLLEGEIVNSIVVDNKNNKWIATQNSGVFYVNYDGTEILKEYNMNNSPLLSNNVKVVTLSPTGEIFFGTDIGLISLKIGEDEIVVEEKKLLIYPNPIKNNYTGDMIVKGCPDVADIKIADISGNLVYAERSIGGQFQWNLKNLKNQRVATGVYFIFITSADGKEVLKSKILIQN